MGNIILFLLSLLFFYTGITFFQEMYKNLNDKQDFWKYLIICLLIIGLFVYLGFMNLIVMIIILFIVLCLMITLSALGKRFFGNTLYIMGMIGTFVFTMFLSGGTFYGIIANYNEDSNKSVSPGYTINNYEVILDVGIDNTIDVTEIINTNFYSFNKHGIYKFVPYWLEYTGKDNKTIKRKSNIIGFSAENDPYTIDTVNKKSRIKIGDPKKIIHGDKVYTIKYTYDMGSDPFEGFDEFIFHAFGDFWDTPIKNPKITINMPKGIDGNTINVYTDKFRKENINNLVNTDISGNKVMITFKDSEHIINKSLTIDIELPENYFVGGSNNYGWGSFIISMIILAITGFIIFMWSRYGKNHSKKVQTVEFYAPDNLSSAEIGYVYNKRQSSKKLTISLIISLASKGYLKIDELTGKDKGKIQITKVLDKPKENPVLQTSKRVISFRKNDSLKPKTILENIVYKNLFKSKNKIILNNHSTFYLCFDEINRELSSTFKKKVIDEEAGKKKFISIILNYIVAMLSLISFFLVEDLDPKLSIIYYLSFGCIIVNLFFIIIMGRKTEYGEAISARVKGFRDFLDLVEKEKLESLVEENPHYFYDILPYTYVLGISKKWVKKFENIKMPVVDMGSFNYYDGDTALNTLSHDIYYPISSPSSHSGSSGGSSSGGGCSSCGGGCSSCGGGGSW